MKNESIDYEQSQIGDAWHMRNVNKLDPDKPDRVVQALLDNDIIPKRVFEVGCGNGWRLAKMAETFGCECWGGDVSQEALFDGDTKYGSLNPKIELRWREAKRLTHVPTEGFDLVVYGFCLYMCKPEDLAKITAEGDRILKNNGYLVVYDFLPDFWHSRVYKHNPDTLIYKYDYAQLWLANPCYSMIARRTFAHEDGDEINNNTRVSVAILKKRTQAPVFKLMEGA